MKNKIIKITPQLLSKLVNEEVSKFSKKAKLTEKFGPYDATGEDDDKETGMHSWNFESATKELMLQALEPVVEEFINSVGRIAYEANPSVDDDERMHELAHEYAFDMNLELLAVIEKYLKQAVEETAGFLSMKKVSLKQLRSIIRESVLQELNISPAFQNEKPVESPLEKQNIGKALGDIERFYRSALLSNLMLQHKDKYNAETRDFDDVAYDQLESLATKHSEDVVAKITEVLEASWSEALSSKGNLYQLKHCYQKIDVYLLLGGIQFQKRSIICHKFLHKNNYVI